MNLGEDPQTDFRQMASGAMAYPAPWTLNRLLFKLPLALIRIGLGFLFWRSMLVLTTTGRKSGAPHQVMLSFFVLDETYYVISGWGESTDWYQNIEADPTVRVRVGPQIWRAQARRVEELREFEQAMQVLLAGSGDSHVRSWLASLEIKPQFPDMLAKRNRIHLIALDR